MMDFPNSPTMGQTFTGPDGNVYSWDGVKWTAAGSIGGGAANVAVTGNLSVGQALTVSGNETVGGTLGVSGASTLTGNTSVGGTLTSTGLATFNGDITTTNETIAGALTVNGLNSIFNGGLTVTNAPGQIDALIIQSGVLVSSGNRITVTGTNAPSFGTFNTGDSIGYAMWSGAGVMGFGACDVGGNPGTPLMHLDASGNLVIKGTLTQSGTP